MAKDLLNKSFPYYDELAYVFEKDKATGRFAETFVDVESNEPVGQGIDMSQDDVRTSRPARTLDGRPRSSGSK
uniref:Uncharacterized protein n=1 Tax=Cucumis melo TaxID=3656 RepID=A0A9I9D5N7_CUCME